MNYQADNLRVVKNTSLLYIRMLFVLGVSIYTSRVVLATLGISDYGIYNVVGSIVSIFEFLKTALSGATHRYISYSLGENKIERLTKIFSTSIILHLLIAILVVALAETVGLWLLSHKLDIPDERMNAAFWVFQLSILTCALTIMAVPFDAEIIAHEKMGAYAYISITSTVLKLLLVLLLAQISYDHLVLYAVSLLLIQVIIFVFYIVYCKKNFKEVSLNFSKDTVLMREMSSFAGWNLFGHAATSLYVQGFNILLNVFFGPIANAARGVALQIENAINGFISNFQMAINPQMTKSFARKDLERYHMLICFSSKISFFLYLLIGLPVFIEIVPILSVWLEEVPDHTSSFLRLTLLGSTATAFFMPLNTACLATGHNRGFLLARGITAISILPIAYFFIKLGCPPESMFAAQTVVLFISVFIQFEIAKPHVNLSFNDYTKRVLLPCVLVLLASLPLPIFCYYTLSTSVFSFFLECIVCVLSVGASAFYLGLSKREQTWIVSKVRKIVFRTFNHG